MANVQVNTEVLHAFSTSEALLGRVTRGQSVSRTLKIETGTATKLRSAAARPDVLKIDVGLSDDQGVIPARLTLNKDAPYGPLAGEVRLEFTGPQDYTLTIPFTAYVGERKDRH